MRVAQCGKPADHLCVLLCVFVCACVCVYVCEVPGDAVKDSSLCPGWSSSAWRESCIAARMTSPPLEHELLSLLLRSLCPFPPSLSLFVSLSLVYFLQTLPHLCRIFLLITFLPFSLFLVLAFNFLLPVSACHLFCLLSFSSAESLSTIYSYVPRPPLLTHVYANSLQQMTKCKHHVSNTLIIHTHTHTHSGNGHTRPKRLQSS